MRLQPVPALDDNYIWLLRDDAGRAVIVDPGDAVPVLAALDDAPPPHAILVTHHHPDHVGGIPDLLDQWPGLPVFAPADPRIPIATQRVREGDVLALGPWAFRALELPGHTRSHLGYIADGVLFCGDTLFSLGCGRLFEGTPAQMLASLDRLAALPGETRVCCTHEYTLANAAFALAVDPGNPDLQSRVMQARAQRATGTPTLPTTLASERACNPFLRSRDPALRDALARHAGQPVADDVEAFALLRRWKDGFRG
ncbi:MAG: hydroxyacylglutathione hydrolase [Xanthomonadales bacterium]|nr:hydroxyacylglutathione hydrolase [Xanthomonadales bacterium]